MSAKMNVPELRFKEFCGEWEEKKLGGLGSFQGGGTPDTTEEKYWHGTIPWISSSDLIDNDLKNIKISRYINEISVKESAAKLIPKDSILFVSRVGVGKLAIAHTDLCTSQDFTNLALKKDNSYFVGYCFLANKTLLLRYSQGTSIKGFTTNDIKTLKLHIPSKPEQEKIASFLSSVDTKIEQLTKKKTLLEQYKKGVMQKIFSQEIRFRDDDGGEYPEWVERKLNSFMIQRNTQAPKSDEYPLMSFVANKGVTQKGDRYNREFLVTDGDNKKYKQTELGDFIYSSNNLETGSIGLNNYGSASISPVYSIFKIKELCNYQFISSFLTRKAFISKMIRYRQGVVYGQWRIHESDFLQIQEKLPSLLEQSKIANFLTSLDSKISQTGQQLDATKQFKKALLQKMFV